MRAKPLSWGDIGEYAEAHGAALSGISIRMLLNSNDPETHHFSHKLHAKEVSRLYRNVRAWIKQGRPQEQPMFSATALDFEALREAAKELLERIRTYEAVKQ